MGSGAKSSKGPLKSESQAASPCEHIIENFAKFHTENQVWSFSHRTQLLAPQSNPNSVLKGAVVYFQNRYPPSPPTHRLITPHNACAFVAGIILLPGMQTGPFTISHAPRILAPGSRLVRASTPTSYPGRMWVSSHPLPHQLIGAYGTPPMNFRHMPPYTLHAFQAFPISAVR